MFRRLLSVNVLAQFCGVALALNGSASRAEDANSSADEREKQRLAAMAEWGDPNTMDRQAVLERTMRPFAGVTRPEVNSQTLTGKVMAGYQGWFNAPGDGAGRGWTHWEWRNKFEPGFCKIDLWPDVSELTPQERVKTPFVHADGRAAEVFSSFNKSTVLRHFRWMKDYGIDGVFVQRFITQTYDPRAYRHVNVVLDHCREGANLYGRTYAVMYDLSGLGEGKMERVIDDWKALVDRMEITKDPAYQRHAGKPVVVVWGFGFSDRRKYTVAEGLELVKFFKDDPKYGGCTVMLGVPTYWRTLNRDCVNDPAMHELILKADIVSPWTVGRYGNPKQAQDYAEKTMKPDLQWCQERSKEFMPVVFPGFSWHNMFSNSVPNQIPRLKGEFLWSQFVEAKKAGATMVYQAMFDEVDEGTAIFKCTDDPPVGVSSFVNYEGLPSDFYLKLVGKATRMLRGELPVSERVPEGK
ncbi:MAG TPA: glycoside hydrolase family 71/99-like protein [Candidatus Limnocylindria bacterium]|nr:glycoside hydrolase family 71/99-like protein [Candidatus Limnocylindria bacterium]